MLFRTAGLALLILTAPVAAQTVNFGDDSSDWSRDGECDDRRFAGPAMATTLTWYDVERDATDCRAALNAGTAHFWDIDAARAATQCNAIDFGDDSGDYPADGECDDRRFEGDQMALILMSDDIRKDATDCARLCASGAIALRDY